MKIQETLRPTIVLASLAAGLLLIFFFVQTFGVNVPVNDDWDHLNTSLSWKAGAIDVQSLFALHNEHCLAVPRIWNHLLLISTGGDFKAVLLATLRSRPRLVVGALVLAYLLSANYPKIHYPFFAMDNGFFQPSEELRGALGIARMIDAERANPGAGMVYVTQAWSTAADVEFYLKHNGVFRSYTRLGDAKKFTVIYNKRFTAPGDVRFRELLAKCGRQKWKQKTMPFSAAGPMAAMNETFAYYSGNLTSRTHAALA